MTEDEHFLTASCGSARHACKQKRALFSRYIMSNSCVFLTEPFENHLFKKSAFGRQNTFPKSVGSDHLRISPNLTLKKSVGSDLNKKHW